MFGPRRGSSVVGLVIFILMWLGALTLVILGHNRLTGLSQEAKTKSLEAEMARKKFDPQKETENLDELFHRRDVLRKEVALLGRELGFGLEKAAEMDDAAFETALRKAVDKLKNDFMGATVKEGLPKFEPKKAGAEITVDRLYDEEMGTGPNFFEKFDILLLMLVDRLVRYEDQLAYYTNLRTMSEDVANRQARTAAMVRNGITRSDPAWQAGGSSDVAFDLPGKTTFVGAVDQQRAALEKMFRTDPSRAGQASSIEDAQARACAQMTQYVIETVDKRIADYDQRIAAEESKLEEAAQAFRTERNALGTSIKNVVKERHRGREVEGTIRILPTIQVSAADPSRRAPSMEDQSSDGEIVVVNPSTREAYVGLGRESGVAEGMKFLVYRQGPQKQWHYRGAVQVKSVLPKMSVVSIVDEVSGFDPISTGDVVFNKVFNAKDPVRVVFLGEMSPQDTARVRHLIERIGGVVENTVTVLTDFVVLLPEYEKHSGSKDNVERAKEIGVKGMTIDELRIYIEY